MRRRSWKGFHKIALRNVCNKFTVAGRSAYLDKGTILTEMYLKYFYCFHVFILCVPSWRKSTRLWFPFSGIRSLVTLQTLRRLLRQTIDITFKNTISTLTLEGETLQNMAIQTPSYMDYYHKRADFSSIPLRRFESRKTLLHKSYVYWTVHHLYSCVKRKKQLDATYFII